MLVNLQSNTHANVLFGLAGPFDVLQESCVCVDPFACITAVWGYTGKREGSPSVEQYFPGGQSVQSYSVAFPCVVLNVPVGHFFGSIEPSSQ